MTGRVRQSLQDTPAVLVNGPRKCGKTTLAKQFAHGMQGGFNPSLQHVLSGGVDGCEDEEGERIATRKVELTRATAGSASGSAMAVLAGNRTRA